MEKKTEVAIGILCDDQGRLLVGRRMRSPHLGKWEMPGGKVEPGESVLDALRREFLEEGCVKLDEVAFWTRIDRDSFILYLFKVTSHDVFTPTIYEEYRYVSPDELSDFDWIETNQIFVPDLRDILQINPVISTSIYHPSNRSELNDCLDEIAQIFRSRNQFSKISCILDFEAPPYADAVELSVKVASLVHQGLTLITPDHHPILSPTISQEERG